MPGNNSSSRKQLATFGLAFGAGAVVAGAYALVQFGGVHLPSALLAIASVASTMGAIQSVVGWVEATSPVGLTLTVGVVVALFSLTATAAVFYWDTRRARDGESVEEAVLGDDFEDFEEL